MSRMALQLFVNLMRFGHVVPPKLRLIAWHKENPGCWQMLRNYVCCLNGNRLLSAGDPDSRLPTSCQRWARFSDALTQQLESYRHLAQEVPGMLGICWKFQRLSWTLFNCPRVTQSISLFATMKVPRYTRSSLFGNISKRKKACK